MSAAPVLEGQPLAAVQHRGSHMQIIASAGSGKTEVVSQRVADLLATDVPASAIVAFTFTERASEELKNRIALRVEERLGRAVLDRIGGLFVGTIHSYCFRLLQQYVRRFETYDVLDDNRLTAFLAREANRLKIKQLDPQGQKRLFASIAAFLRGIDVVENELLAADSMPEPFRSVLQDYEKTLARYRLLTYGQQVANAVRALEDPGTSEKVHAGLRHLIVDEYQDVNPAQERLIELLTGPGTELCVVGDDDQAIYQWRGSDVSNIVGFTKRYAGVATFEIVVNRRSRPGIIAVANEFVVSIPERLPKTMKPHRKAGGGAPEVALWTAPTEAEEAAGIASTIRRLADEGVPYADIAVLVRSRAAYARLVEALADAGVPVQPGGRTGLFEQPEAVLLGKTFSWLADVDWRPQYGQGAKVGDAVLLNEYEVLFGLDPAHRDRLRKRLEAWKTDVPVDNRSADLVGELYKLLDVLDVRTWDLDDALALNRIGTLARFTTLLVDYEAVRRRARSDDDNPGQQVGGEGRGGWYYKNLAFHILNHAQGAYEGFEGEADYVLDAVDLTTVHRAKGLEWPVVFVPSLTKGRFPSRYAGKVQPSLVPRDRYPAERYEGSDADERRLFYVAMTRARDWLSVSRHEKTNVKRTGASPYFTELAKHEVKPQKLILPPVEPTTAGDDEPITLTFSQLASFIECGFAFRLRDRIGFQPRLATELGYGKAVHHVLRTVAEETRDKGVVPSSARLSTILDESFFLPTANRVAHSELKEAARRLVTTYATKHRDDLHRVWETERPFELHLDGITVTGRADVILDHEGGVPTSLALLDYKTSTSGDPLDHALQLQVYTDAGRREGLDVRAAFVHDLKAADRTNVPVGEAAITAAEETVGRAAARLRGREYVPNPGERCKKCEVRTICPVARL